jgi:hypothetical protein
MQKVVLVHDTASQPWEAESVGVVVDHVDPL